jgi:hypothetical protein
MVTVKKFSAKDPELVFLRRTSTTKAGCSSLLLLNSQAITQFMCGKRLAVDVGSGVELPAPRALWTDQAVITERSPEWRAGYSLTDWMQLILFIRELRTKIQINFNPEDIRRRKYFWALKPTRRKKGK